MASAASARATSDIDGLVRGDLTRFLGEIEDQDPDSANVLAYDAARYAGTAIHAHQGLRPTTSGGHYAVEVALGAQFGDGFRPLAQCGEGETNSSTPL